ncbi:MAG: shikimate dehydrogenase [Porphyromonadaceae bacterium]|nr:shikimate dehydrogenase [Porphyromonadaceae bacterium]
MKQYGLIGNPLKHSFSADFFNNLFVREGIDAYYAPYELGHIKELEELLTRVPLQGLNVTAPYKQEVLRYATELSPEVEAIGAANVLRIDRNTSGKIVHIKAFNTDVVGFSETVHSLVRQNDLALVLGTGGAALAVRYALMQLGLCVLLVSRGARAEGVVPYKDLRNLLPLARLLVNATPIGLHEGQRLKLPYDLIEARHLCYDLIYNPTETPFLLEARLRGAQTMNGLAMLHGQALAAWDIWH